MNIKTLKKEQGITLTELVVASILVGIIMLGIVSVDYATRQSQQKATSVSQLAMSTGGLMLDIMKNASLAVGDASNTTNSGIYIAPGGATACFRQDLLKTPANYADDSWICYTEASNQVLKCTRATVGTCSSGSTVMGTVISGGFQPQLTNDGQNLFLRVTLTTRTNPALPKDQLTNPEYSIQANQSPLAQGGPISQL